MAEIRKPMPSGEDAVRTWASEAARLEREGLYDPAFEHDACGVGFVAAIDGTPSRRIVQYGINALKCVWHRGAVDADGKTGDGAGIHVQIPQDFFQEHIRRTGHEPGDERIAVGMVFLPKTDLGAQETCRSIVESEILRLGYSIHGWRQVPVDVSVIGEKANATRPEIEQIMIANNQGTDDDKFETDLYIIRRRIEKLVQANSINDFYICSLSCRSIIYKGMFLAEQLTSFYPDLEDERFVSNFAIFHQRYSTNTFPMWRLAQPFRMLAHNGEINTLTGNKRWTTAHEPRMASPILGDAIEDIKPVLQASGSDTANLDNLFELLVRAGRPAPMVKALMIPESVTQNQTMPEHHQALFTYCNSVLEPWDGPAGIVAYDGRWVIAGMDRNGLRPMRYALSRDGIFMVGSETGMIDFAEESIIEKGRVGPGHILGIDLAEGKLYRDPAMKDLLAARQPYEKWVKNTVLLEGLLEGSGVAETLFNADELRTRQVAFGLTLEDGDVVLQPMAETGKEPVGSMGDDTPPAVLSENYRGLHHFFRQMFSQVSNPPIDSLREYRVMSLKTRLGNLGNILEEEEGQCKILQLESPVVTTAEYRALRKYMGDTAYEIDCTFEAGGAHDALRKALDRVRREAEDAVRGGHTHVLLTDEAMSRERAAIPMILATAAVHTHLVQQHLRTFTSLNVRSAECIDVHYFAVLIGCGASTVNAYLAEDWIKDRHARGLLGGKSLEVCVANYKEAVNQGLLKIMSKMGIGVISSYRGGLIFETVGLSRSLVAEFFPGMPSRISGMGLNGIAAKVLAQHAKAFDEEVISLPVGGFYRYRDGAERHGHDGRLIKLLQDAVLTEDYSKYKEYSESLNSRAPINLRDLLGFRPVNAPLPVEAVESITEIRKRFCAPAMSLGALSPEAHETLAIAMNRIGAKSNSGEGGEGSERFKPRPNGDNPCSPVKQVASGRFGVTAEYLNNCREIQIKMAQGAKPGEGGQLPGFKVTVEIARLRHSTPGVSLISPPPHHDIYSIEDLAQLIYDLKQINPEAQVCVKLVARAGVGTIAAGVAKAMADVILISGHVGGTGASPLSSIKYAGIPWEMGLSEAHQVLTLNRLRHRVKLRTDGGLKNGRDVVIAAMLGAEEFGFGTSSLMAMGCLMVRQCHSNTCPVGVCTQDQALRSRFNGTPERVVNFFTFIAEEVKEILAQLGMKSLDEVIGRSDLLYQLSRGDSSLDDLDLNPLLAQADAGGFATRCTLVGRNEVPDTLDAQMIKDARSTIEWGEKMQLTYLVRNTHRAVGTRLSSILTRKWGMHTLAPDHLTVRLQGSAGQSLGAFAVQGLTLEVLGDANDYVGKGLSGATIVVRPPIASRRPTEASTIIGNTVLYGATSGKLFAAGQAAERFCVRNSGALTVVEGCGSNGCEYMTGGVAVILGEVGANFAAGMTGGMAYVYDPKDVFRYRLNGDSVVAQRVETAHWEGVLRDLIEEHLKRTQSRHAARILEDWDAEKEKFWQIVPKEMIDRLEHPVRTPEVALAAAGED